MRYALLILLCFCCVGVSSAQSGILLEAHQDERLLQRHGAEPDSTSPWRYFPLEIGNEWQYELYDPETGGIGYEGYRVRADTLIDGRLYYVLRYCLSSQNCSRPETDRILRFDTTNALVIERVVIAGQSQEFAWDQVPCALDAPFDSSQIDCRGLGDDQQYFVTGGYDYTLILDPDTIEAVTYKEFDSIEVVMGVVADFGVVSRVYQKQPRPIETLVYAKIGGDEYGTPGFVFPSAVEPDLVDRRVELSVSPNPMSKASVVSFELSEPEHIKLELLDVLGRRLRSLAHGHFNTGSQAVRFDRAGLPNGVYVLRATFEASRGRSIRVVSQRLTILN